MVFLLGDLDLPIRDRIYREPDGPHVLICQGRLLGDALEHLKARPDCRSLAVLGLPAEPPDLSTLKGRRLLVADRDRARRRRFVEAAMKIGAEVESFGEKSPPVERVAAWALPVGAVVLAAGSGTRMGRQKLLLDVGGRPLVRHVAEAAARGGCDEVVLVYSDPAVADAVADVARCVRNRDAATGLASSLRVGLEALRPHAAGAAILLGDQPLVHPASIEALLRAWRREGARVAAATGFAGEDGHGPRWRPPVVLDRTLFPELVALSGDEGARQHLARHPELVDIVPSTDPPHDVDTPEDYAKIVELFPKPGPATGKRPRR